MAEVKIKMVRNSLVKGKLYEDQKIYSVDEETGANLMRLGKAVPAENQTKKVPK